ncbi:MAG: hemerythrin protein [Gammaproteobacteria bacterium]|nr:hemerythrin protein [Gammaproteobacteria bacterium]
MTTITEYMTGVHRHCDEILAELEVAVSEDDWDKAARLSADFLQAMEHHLTMEETVLFPAFEQKTGMIGGPTMIMREEHRQMRELFQQLQWALDGKASGEFLDTTETLLILMQQHNIKEEGILYPMSDQHLGTDAPQVLARMQKV